VRHSTSIDEASREVNEGEEETQKQRKQVTAEGEIQKSILLLLFSVHQIITK
jgi:hypothetical protein